MGLVWVVWTQGRVGMREGRDEGVGMREEEEEGVGEEGVGEEGVGEEREDGTILREPERVGLSTGWAAG